jgi:uncharacterized protein
LRLAAVVECPPTRHDHRVGVPTTQDTRVVGADLEGVDPEQQIFWHHAVRRGAEFGAPRSLTQPSHVTSIYRHGVATQGLRYPASDVVRHRLGEPDRRPRRPTCSNIDKTARRTKELDVTRKLPRWIGATITGVVAGVAIAATASAHVHVEVEDDGEAIAGQPAQLVFEVPNERDDAATMTIEIQMPNEADLSDVVPAEVEGWTITVTTREGTTVEGDVVDTIRWDATGPGLVGEESAELPVAVGPLPDVEFLTFPTIQIYDDGETVRWIEPAPAGEPEPELPVPTLAITPASPDDTTAPTEPPSTDAPEPTAAPATEPATEATTPSTEVAVVATAPSDTTGAPTTEVTAPPTTVETDEDDGSSAWPWVIGGLVIVLVVGGIAFAIARRKSSP